jgi:polyhydroxybutyrate depolymerase
VKRFSAFATGGVIAAAFCAACGSSGQTHSASPSSGGASGADAGFDANPWPDAAPPSDAAPAPSPAFDGGSDAGAAFACAGKTGKAGDSTITLTFGGLLRSSMLHVPSSYDPAHGAMLVMNFHGFSSADWQEALLTHMSTTADQRGFIVAYPEGVATSWNAGDCCGTAWTNSVDDIGFVNALLDKIENEYCIDPKRVFATGMSNGGFLTHRIGCALASRFAAIAPVAGVLGIPEAQCKPGRPVPILDFHGTSDPLVPYDGGTPLDPQLGVGLVFRSVAETMQFWRTNNGCTNQTSVFYQHGDATCQEWNECQSGAETALCTIDGGGHTWPGGLPVPVLGKTSTDIDATNAMIDFFDAHPMP